MKLPQSNDPKGFDALVARYENEVVPLWNSGQPDHALILLDEIIGEADGMNLTGRADYISMLRSKAIMLRSENRIEEAEDVYDKISDVLISWNTEVRETGISLRLSLSIMNALREYGDYSFMRARLDDAILAIRLAYNYSLRDIIRNLIDAGLHDDDFKGLLNIDAVEMPPEGTWDEVSSLARDRSEKEAEYRACEAAILEVITSDHPLEALWQCDLRIVTLFDTMQRGSLASEQACKALEIIGRRFGLLSREYASRAKELLGSRLSNVATSDQGGSETSLIDSRNTYHPSLSTYAPMVRRIFVSSTFKDMHAERDLLKLRLAPALADACRPHGEEIDLVDLRWGIDTINMDDLSSSCKVIDACLREIDSCRPYILCLIGDRYGWEPKDKVWSRVLSDEARQALSSRMEECGGIEFDTLSVTAAEMLYGTLDSEYGEARVIACLRDGKIPELAASETAGGPEVKSLRQYLSDLPQSRVFHYEVHPSHGAGLQCSAEVTDDDDRGKPLADAIAEYLIGEFGKEWEGEAAVGRYDRMWLLNERYAAHASESGMVLPRVMRALEAARSKDRRAICIRESEGTIHTSVLSSEYCRLKSSGKRVVSLFADAIGPCDVSKALEFIEISLRELFELGQLLPSENVIGGVGSSKSTSSLAEEFEGRLLRIERERKGIAIDDDRTISLRSARNASEYDDAYTTIIVDSPERIPRLVEILSLVSASPKLEVYTAYAFLLSWADKSTLPAHLESVDIPALTEDECVEVIGHECEKRGRELSPRTLVEVRRKGAGKDSVYVSLLAGYLNSLGGEVLARPKGKDQRDLAIANEVKTLPDDTIGLCWRIEGSVAEDVSGEFVDTLLASTCIRKSGITKAELRRALSSQGVPWDDVKYSRTRTMLSGIIREMADGRLQIAPDSFRKDVLASHICSPKLRQCMLSISLGEVPLGVAHLEGMLEAAISVGAEHVLLSLTDLAVGGKGIPYAQLQEALYSCCADDDGLSYSEALRHAAWDLLDKGDYAGRCTVDALSFALYFAETVYRQDTEASCRIVANVGPAALELYDAMLESGIFVGHLDAGKDRVARSVDVARLRSDPNRWEPVICHSGRLPSVTSGRTRLAATNTPSLLGENNNWQRLSLNGDTVYDLDLHGPWNPMQSDVEFVGYGDLGLSCILALGYPFTSITDDDTTDWFITQAAVWMYLSELGCSLPLPSEFTDAGEDPVVDPYRIRGKIQSMVSKGLEIREKATSAGEAHRPRKISAVKMNGKTYVSCIYSSQSWSRSLVVKLTEYQSS